MLECVILDMDGTLLDTEKMSVGAWQRAGRKYGYEIPADFIIDYFGMNREGIDRRYRETFGPDFPIDQVRAERMAEGMRVAREEAIPVKPGAHELARHLRDRGLKVALATGTELERAKLLLTRTGLWEYLDEAVCGSMVPNGKPAPDIFLEAARRVGAAPERCLVVEDTENGAWGGLAAGCRVVIVPDIRQPGEEITPRLEGVCPSLLEVIPLVDRLMAEP